MLTFIKEVCNANFGNWCYENSAVKSIVYSEFLLSVLIAFIRIQADFLMKNCNFIDYFVEQEPAV